MNSYGDPSSSRGRAQIPGANGDPGAGSADAYRRGDDARGSWSEAPAQPGRASVPPRGPAAGGRASVGGSAPVPPRAGGAPVPPRAGGASGSASVGSVPVGRAGAGRASVPVSPAPGPVAGRAGAGRASVPVSPAPVSPAGRASVGVGSAGRASVGAASVGATSFGGGAGRASVARASVSPASGIAAPSGGGDRGPDGRTKSARARKRRRANILIACFAVFIMLAGIGVVGFTYYSTNVVLPEDTAPPQATTLYAFDNKTIIAKVGEQNRTLVTIDQIPQHVQDAVAAAEDRNFYRHSGVDYKGIARAAWNNISGGDKQGASTITQQYARNAYDNLKDDTYARKVKEAILASKLNDKYGKPQIMQHYLNVIYFGRGAYGIEAAAQTYFGKPAKSLTVAEGAVLAALIKQPVASSTHKGYDPAVNPVDAKSRWDYVINGMVEEGWLDAPGKPQRPTEYPKNIKSPKNGGAGIDFGVNTPYGNVINYVKVEMREKGLCVDKEAEVTDQKPLCSQALMAGGYRIRTTIDTKIQKAAVEAAQRKTKGSELAGQPKNLMAAVVAIDPANGRVVAYYGGDNGTGTDYAGKNTDANGTVSGGHSPGSSFKIYTLAAALKAGKALESRWKGRAFTPEGTKFKVSNAGVDNPSCGNSCTLRVSTLKSLNVPFYHVTEEIGPDKVIDMAKQAGVTMMWRTDTNPAKAYDLTKTDPKDIAPSPFFHVVGYGQYPITVLDHANGVATFANEGVYNKAHFLYSVEKQNETTGKWEKISSEKIESKRRIDKDVVADVTSVLKEYPGQVNHRLADGREATAKTGTWELKSDSPENGDAWMIGYTPQLATAVWVGNVQKRLPLKLSDGRKVSGANLPGGIWERFMNDALKGEPKKSFPPAANVGDPEAGNGDPPPPPEPTNPTPPDCDPQNIFCPQNPGNGNPGNGGLPGNPDGPDSPTNPGPGNDGGNSGGLLPTIAPRTNRE
ncbi:glycosyl transferase family 51 [Micromonospora sp. ATCC 39149]|uniref:Transglycosylase domain-containing protein n=1 Tax=Micromonospora carbonacea TaxID=47853 RepID=A0A7D6CE13_9ACTN|nr:transglycosylase domain-containing protein [Micromonospora sp. ATCC 39149]EEP72522.1 glycosyl transferase family 51 [Micromonospora sp. ATCC 39149]QLJ98649.1 transglycosylase domain-containing protein [Micromonospora carbonacea]